MRNDRNLLKTYTNKNQLPYSSSEPDSDSESELVEELEIFSLEDLSQQ